MVATRTRTSPSQLLHLDDAEQPQKSLLNLPTPYPTPKPTRKPTNEGRVQGTQIYRPFGNLAPASLPNYLAHNSCSLRLRSQAHRPQQPPGKHPPRAYAYLVCLRQRCQRCRHILLAEEGSIQATRNLRQQHTHDRRPALRRRGDRLG